MKRINYCQGCGARWHDHWVTHKAKCPVFERQSALLETFEGYESLMRVVTLARNGRAYKRELKRVVTLTKTNPELQKLLNQLVSNLEGK